MEKKQKGIGKFLIGSIIFVIAASAFVIAPKFAMDNTKEAAIENLNEKYNEDFTITHSTLSNRPFKDTFSGIVKSNVTGATYNMDIVEGEGTIPDYELESYYMTYNTMAEELFPDSLALTYADDKDVAMRIITLQDITQAQMDEFEQVVKATYNDVTVTVETIQVSKEVYEQMLNDIPLNYQRSVIAPDATFDNFDPVIKTFKF